MTAIEFKILKEEGTTLYCTTYLTGITCSQQITRCKTKKI